MESLITAFALMVSIYAVAPRERQLAFDIRLGAFTRLSGILLVAVGLYLNYYPFLEAHQLAPAIDQWPRGLSPSGLLPLVVLIWVGVLIFVAKYARFSAGHLPRLRQFTEELLWNEHHVTLLALLDQSLRDLFRIANRMTLSQRLRRSLMWAQPYRSMEAFVAESDVLLDDMEGRTKGESAPRGRSLHRRSPPSLALHPLLAKTLLRIVPANDDRSRGAHDILRVIFLNSGFVRSLARYRPYMAVEIIRGWGAAQENKTFVTLFLQELLRAETSILYSEIANNRSQSRTNRYDIPAYNRLLHFLFSDVRIAHELHVYRPVGDYVLKELDALSRNHEQDPYNQTLGDFEEQGRWRSSLYIAIHFFDIMVTEAIFQNISWHMWLYYFPLFVQGIAKNYWTGLRFEAKRADTNKYGELLRVIFRTLRDWVIAADELPVGQQNCRLRAADASNENGNIPKSAIIALVQSLYHVLAAYNIPLDVKKELSELVFRLYFSLRKSAAMSSYAEVVTEAICNVSDFRHPRNSRDCLPLLRKFFLENEEAYQRTERQPDINKLKTTLGLLA